MIQWMSSHLIYNCSVNKKQQHEVKMHNDVICHSSLDDFPGYFLC